MGLDLKTFAVSKNVSKKMISDNNNSISKSELDDYYKQSTGYTDKQLNQLINGAPETLNTLKEIADAIQENDVIVDSLNSAIGNKANQLEVDTHIENDIIHITSSERETWNSKQDAATAITGIKGDVESSYRTGNVNLTPANIGALPVNGTAKNAEALGNTPLRPSSAPYTWPYIPKVGSDGVMEVGKYIDFHATSDDTSNNCARITADPEGLSVSGLLRGTFVGSLDGTAEKANKLNLVNAQGGKIPCTFHWVLQTGQPTWVWGGDTSANQYVYNPANFEVKSAEGIRYLTDNYKQGTDLPGTYPKGEYLFFTNNPADKFNGQSYGTIHTIKPGDTGNPNCIQFLYPYNSNEDKIYFREAIYNKNEWRPWYELITSANISSQTVNKANSVTLTNATTDAYRNVWFSNSDDASKAVYNTNFQYNPFTGILKVPKAKITTTGNSWLAGKTMAAINVSNTPTDGGFYPVLRMPTKSGHVATLGTINDNLYIVGYKSDRTTNDIDWGTHWEVATGKLIHAGTIEAASFKGTLEGNASTATKSAQDGDGNNIVSTYATKEEFKNRDSSYDSFVLYTSTTGAPNYISGTYQGTIDYTKYSMIMLCFTNPYRANVYCSTTVPTATINTGSMYSTTLWCHSNAVPSKSGSASDAFSSTITMSAKFKPYSKEWSLFIQSSCVGYVVLELICIKK